jgi:hypothetical protein
MRWLLSIYQFFVMSLDAGDRSRELLPLECRAVKFQIWLPNGKLSQSQGLTLRKRYLRLKGKWNYLRVQYYRSIANNRFLSISRAEMKEKHALQLFKALLKPKNMVVTEEIAKKSCKPGIFRPSERNRDPARLPGTRLTCSQRCRIFTL